MDGDIQELVRDWSKRLQCNKPMTMYMINILLNIHKCGYIYNFITICMDLIPLSV